MTTILTTKLALLATGLAAIRGSLGIHLFGYGRRSQQSPITLSNADVDLLVAQCDRADWLENGEE